MLIQRHRQGLSLRWCDVCCENFALAVAAKASFGNWSNALITVGIAESETRKSFKWSREKVLRHFKRGANRRDARRWPA